jgi:restriction system protein
MRGSFEEVILEMVSDFERQVEDLNRQLAPLQQKKAELERKLRHLRSSLATNGELAKDLKTTPNSATVSESQASPRNEFTPVDKYWTPIIESLIELGGSARSDEVIARVGKKMDSVLTRADRELLPSGIDIRWRNRVAWQRENMKRQGLLRNDSPRGVWEITEAGREWLKKNRP